MNVTQIVGQQIGQPTTNQQVNATISGISPARAARIPEWLEMIRQCCERDARGALPALPSKPAGDNGDAEGKGHERMGLHDAARP
jgi:hypothetical protein